MIISTFSKIKKDMSNFSISIYFNELNLRISIGWSIIFKLKLTK